MMNYETDPDLFVRNFLDERGINKESIGITPIVLVIWDNKLVELFIKKINAELSTNWFYNNLYPIYIGKTQGLSITILQAPRGAPGTIKIMEEMIICGARIFIGIGKTYQLQKTINTGSFIIPDNCISEDFTSSLYLKKRGLLQPDKNILELFKKSNLNRKYPIFFGTIWTSDVPTRESIEKIERYRKQGVLGVDMETSAMYTLGKFRGVKVCNILIAFNEIENITNSEANQKELQNEFQEITNIVLDNIPLIC